MSKGSKASALPQVRIPGHVFLPERKIPRYLHTHIALTTITSLQGSPFVDVNAVSARKTRLLKERSYARSEPFETANIAVPPTLDDLAPPISSIIDKFYVSTPAIIMAFAAAYFTFPFITESLHGIITASEDSINEILGTFAPGISILYGTFVSLTLSILYNRQRTIQDNVAVECSLLTILLRNSLRLFKRDEERIVEAGQCVADQVRTLVRSSRGKELMLLMYSDPYARILDLIDDLEEEQQLLTTVSTAKVPSVGLIAYSRDTIRELIRFRAKRLSDETLALPPTHYFILNILTFLILMCYAISVLPTYDELTGSPPNESSLLFATLSTIYILFYNFANDLNNPFQGVYQVRRSCAASHLLETKWVIANHPLLKEKVDFEEVEEEEDGSVLIRSPGLGDYWFDRDRIYLKHEGDGEDTTNGCDDTLK